MGRIGKIEVNCSFARAIDKDKWVNLKHIVDLEIQTFDYGLYAIIGTFSNNTAMLLADGYETLTAARDDLDELIECIYTTS